MMRCLPCEWLANAWHWATGPSFDDDVSKIRDLTVKVCGFLPTVGTVISILKASNPAVMGVVAVATAICEAVKPKPAATVGLLTLPPAVNGVPIEGEFVK